MALVKDECNYLDIARTISIFQVIICHFPYHEGMMYEKTLVYSFNALAIFFFISGMFHRVPPINITSVKKMVMSLFVPYIIFNVIFAIGRYLLGVPILSFGDLFVCILTATILPSGATWFFYCLFTIKIATLLIRTKTAFIVTTILCLAYLYFFVDPVGDLYHGIYSNIFKYKSTLLSFPFFALGYLMKDVFLKDEFMKKRISPIFKVVFCVVGIAVLLYMTFTEEPYYLYVNGRDVLVLTAVDMVFPWFSADLIKIYVGSFIYVFSLLFICQFISLYYKNDFLKTLSRGTMMIVATHIVFMLGNPLLSKMEAGFITYLFLGILIMIFYYFFIKLTYDRWKLLYGRAKWA